jgi:hypothetical protein
MPLIALRKPTLPPKKRTVVHRKEGDDNMYVPLEIVPSDVEENDERYA